MATQSEATFLKAIIADPENDRPRLEYAAWLDEQGEGEHAEFIRVQCELAKTERHDPAYPMLQRRERVLEIEAQRRWNPEPLNNYNVYFKRGLPYGITFTSGEAVENFIGDAEAIFRQAPLQSLAIDTLHTERDPDGSETLQRLVGCEALLHLRNLSISRTTDGEQPIADEGACIIAEASTLANLDSIRLANQQITENGAEALAASPYLRHLLKLDLTANMLGNRGLKHIATAHFSPSIEYLQLTANGIGADGIRDFAEEADMPALKKLNVGHNAIGPYGAEALAQAEGLSAIESLDLPANKTGLTGARHIFESPNFPKLAALNLAENGITTTSVAVLSTRPTLGQLKRLDLSKNALGDEGASSLAASAFVENLEVLELRDCAIGAHGTARLADSPYLNNLHTLSLMDNLIGPEGARALAHAQGLQSLASLSLSGPGIGTDGAQELAAATGLKRLQELHLLPGFNISEVMGAIDNLVTTGFQSPDAQLTGFFAANRGNQALVDGFQQRLRGNPDSLPCLSIINGEALPPRRETAYRGNIKKGDGTPTLEYPTG